MVNVVVSRRYFRNRRGSLFQKLRVQLFTSGATGMQLVANTRPRKNTGKALASLSSWVADLPADVFSRFVCARASLFVSCTCPSLLDIYLSITPHDTCVGSAAPTTWSCGTFGSASFAVVGCHRITQVACLPKSFRQEWRQLRIWCTDFICRGRIYLLGMMPRSHFLLP